MKNTVVTLAAAFFLLSAPGRADIEDTGNVFMWEASSETATVYLLGTVHFAHEDIYPLDGSIERAFEKADTLVMEISMSAQTQMEAAMLTMQHGMYTGQETLADNIPEETFARLTDVLAEHGMPVAMVNRMRPWLASLTVVMMEYMAQGFEATEGIDKHFYDRAVKRGLPVWQLETAESQIKMFAAGTDEEHALALSAALDQIPDVAEFLEEMMKTWLAGDADALYELIKDQMGEDERLKARAERLIYERNEAMLEKIEKLFEREGTYFVMVGAAHLVGERGIVAGLVDKGHSIVQVEKERATADVSQ